MTADVLAKLIFDLLREETIKLDPTQEATLKTYSELTLNETLALERMADGVLTKLFNSQSTTHFLGEGMCCLYCGAYNVSETEECPSLTCNSSYGSLISAPKIIKP